MCKILSLLLFLTFPSISAQELIIDYNQLSDEVLKQINSHRKIFYLTNKKIVNKNHIKYYQKNDFNITGENVLFTTISVSLCSKKGYKSLYFDYFS